MTDEELLNGLRSEMLAGEGKNFVDAVHERALAYLNEPPADLYHRYMEVASVMRAGGRSEFAGLLEAQREANEQLRRVWIAWLVAAYEHEMGRLGDPNALKYEQAAKSPWLPVEPDEPQPLPE